jgi:hypothetical protein
MVSITLVHPEATLTVPALDAIKKCSLFQSNPALAAAPYNLRSSVPLSLFRQFVSALEGNAIEITSANFSGLSQLSDEFGFSELRSKLSESPPLHEVEDAEARSRIAALEEWAHRRDGDIAGFQAKFTRLETDIGRLASEVAALRSAPSDRIPQNLSKEVTRLQSDVSAEKATIAAAPPTAPATSLDSLIVSTFPAIFAEFHGKRFQILWRGSRDGFGASQFHGRCDGHANTLTVILDTNGNIFGGFTPVEWESRVHNGKRGDEDNTFKADDSRTSFVFTLKNPHKVAARRFALKAAERHVAIRCHSQFGPWFGYDIGVLWDSNANTTSWTDLGWSYTNDTGMAQDRFFTGSFNFQAKEIEVFEITG